MPIIPTFQESGQEYPNRPVESNVEPNRWGQDLEMLGRVGGEIGDFGSRLMTARKRAAENDAVSQAHFDDIKWLADTSEQMKLQYTKKDKDGKPVLNPDGTVAYDADGFASAFGKAMQERRQAQADGMPTGDAQRQYIDATNRNFGLAYHEAVTWENVTKAKSYRANFQLRDNEDANYLVNQQNPYNAIEFTKNSIDAQRESLNNSIGTTNTAEEAQALFHNSARTRVNALFIGLGNNPESAKVGLNLLNSITTGQPRDYKTGDVIPGTKLDARMVQDSLTAEEIGTIRKRLESVVDTGLRSRVEELRGWLRDQQAILSSNDPKDLQRFNGPEAVENLRELQALNKQDNKLVSDRDFHEAVVNVTMGKAYSVVRKEMAMMPDNDKAKFDERINQEYKAMISAFGLKDGYALADKQHYQALNERAWNSFQAERARDPVAYVENYGKNPGGGADQFGIPDEQRMRWRKGQQQMIGWDGGVLTKGEVANTVTAWKNLAETNPQEATKRLESMKQASGGFAGETMEQLTQQGKLPDYFQTAFHMDSPTVAESIIKNNEPKMKKALMESVNAKDKKALEESIVKKMGPAIKTFSVAGGIKPAEDLKNAVMLESLAQRADGKDDKTAVGNAYEKIIGSQYHIIGTTFVPKQIGRVMTNPNYIEGEMQAIYKPENQARLGIQAPGSVDGKADRALSIGMGRWVTDPSNHSATFMVPYGSSWTAVRDKSGKPVQLDFVRASLNPSQGAVDYNKHWWEFGGGLGDDMKQTDPMASFHGQRKPESESSALAGGEAKASSASVKFDKGISQEDRVASAERLNMKGNLGGSILDAVKDPSLIAEKVYDPSSKKTRVKLKDGRTMVLSGDLR